jgi:uncharacterized membrane protein YccC
LAEEPSRPARITRGDEALEYLTTLSRQGVRERLRRLRHTALPIVQCAVAAALAWWVATSPPIDHERPFFAPIAALISVGVGLGQRLPRVVELVVGVAVGVLVGDLLVAWIGTGIAQIALVVALAMVAAVVLGGGAVIITQAGASAVLVATLTAPEGGLDLDRFVDALVGGIVGLAVIAVLLPVNPVAAVRRELDPLLGTLADLIDDCADALAERDRIGAGRALGRARETQASVDAMNEALEGSSEVALIAPARWRARGQLTGYIDAGEPIDHVARDLRVMARHVVSMLSRKEPMPPQLPKSLRALPGAVRLLRIDLAHGDEPQESRANAVAAAELATEALDETGGFAGQVVVAQTRSLAVDVLRATGLEREKALRLLPSLPPGPVSYG